MLKYIELLGIGAMLMPSVLFAYQHYRGINFSSEFSYVLSMALVAVFLFQLALVAILRKTKKTPRNSFLFYLAIYNPAFLALQIEVYLLSHFAGIVVNAIFIVFLVGVFGWHVVHAQK